MARWTALTTTRPAERLRNQVRNSPAAPPRIDRSCSVCSWISRPLRKKRTTTVWPGTNGRSSPRTRHDVRVSATCRPPSRITFWAVSVIVPWAGAGAGGTCAAAVAGSRSAAVSAAGKGGAARCPARVASKAMASVVMTLPTDSSRNPHQGSPFVTPNEIELWNACNMMHGISDAVQRNSTHSPTPNRLSTIVPTQSPLGRCTSPNAIPVIATESTTPVFSCRTRSRKPRKKNSSATGASRQVIAPNATSTTTESSALRSVTMSCSSGWPKTRPATTAHTQNPA